MVPQERLGALLFDYDRQHVMEMHRAFERKVDIILPDPQRSDADLITKNSDNPLHIVARA
jgi:hypothetical protein